MNIHEKLAKESILREFGESYSVEYPSGEKGTITARITKVDKEKRLFWSAMIASRVPNGTVIIIDSKRFKISDQRSGMIASLALVEESKRETYSEYGQNRDRN